LTLASPRYEVSASILLQRFLAKSIHKGIGGDRADLHKSHDCPPAEHIQVIRRFGLRFQVADLPKSATFNYLPMTQILNPPLGRGEDGLGCHFIPPPHIREFFFASFSLVI
jgi:hypothetical protein